MRALAIVLVSLVALAVASPSARAVEKKLTPQQQKMATCSKENKGKKGAEYKQAVSDCLNRDLAASPNQPMTQQQKMTACSKANAGKKGDDYKTAMKDCLSQ